MALTLTSDYIKYDMALQEYYITQDCITNYTTYNSSDLGLIFANANKAIKIISHSVYRMIYNWRKGVGGRDHIKYMRKKIYDNNNEEVTALMFAMIEAVKGAIESGMDLNAYINEPKDTLPHTVKEELTALGGQADFCTPDTAWLIDGHFERAQTHMELDDSVWVEPDFDDLVAKMRMIPKLPKADIQTKTTAARSKILAHHTWDGAVSRLIKACDRVKALEALGEEPRIGWVTTWNCACGIASYSQMLTRAFSEKITILTNYVDDSRPEKDSGHVIRCWETGGKDSLAHLFDVITGQGLTRVVIQFNFSFFDLKALGRLIVALEERGIRTFLFFHSTADVKPPNEPKTISLILKELRRCCRLFVHSVHDLNRFKKWGLVENVALFPHGVDVKPPRADSNEDRADDGPLIAGFGFLLPHKGIFELIKAFRILRDSRPGARLMLLTALYPGGLSDHENQRCKKLLESMPFSKDITLVTDYLGESDIHHRLSKADIIVYPYRNTQESSSAAVRAGLAAMVPVAVSPLDIFEDVADVVHVLPGFSPEQIVQGIKAVLDDHEGKAKISERQTKWLNTHDWHVIGRRLYNILSAFGPVRPTGP